MAKNRPDAEEDSGDEMEVSSPENAPSESESESEQEQQPPPKNPPATALKKPPPQDSSSSSSDSESGSDSDPGTRKPNPSIKPISSKPMDDAQKSAPPTTAKKPRSKTNPNSTAKPTSPTRSTTGAGAKRPAEKVEDKESKRSKKKSVPEIENSAKKAPNEDGKKQLFQRLWSEDDEIAVLKGMIDYAAKKKADPVADLNAFHDFIKKSLHVDVSKTQLQDKIRRLRKKYQNNAAKERKGKERTFSKPHEQKAYELSKKIWGKDKAEKAEKGQVENETGRKGQNGQSRSEAKDNGVSDEVKEDKESEKVEKIVEGSQNLNLVICGRSVAALEEWLEESSGLIGMDTRDDMKAKLKSLKLAEADLYLKKVELIHEQGKLVIDAMKASGIDIFEK